MTPQAAVEAAINWNGLEKILRGMRARNEAGSLELTNWIADNRGRTHQPPTDEQKVSELLADAQKTVRPQVLREREAEKFSYHPDQNAAPALPVELEGQLLSDIELLQSFVSDRNNFGGSSIDDAIRNVCSAALYAQSPARVNRELYDTHEAIPKEITDDGKQWKLMGGWYGTPANIGLMLQTYLSAEQLERSKPE